MEEGDKILKILSDGQYKFILYKSEKTSMFNIINVNKDIIYEIPDIIDIKYCDAFFEQNNGCFTIICKNKVFEEEKKYGKYIIQFYIIKKTDEIIVVNFEAKIKNRRYDNYYLDEKYDVTTKISPYVDNSYVFSHNNFTSVCLSFEKNQFIISTFESLWIYNIITKIIKRVKIIFYNIKNIIMRNNLLYILDGNNIYVYNEDWARISKYVSNAEIQNMEVDNSHIGVVEILNDKYYFKLFKISSWECVLKKCSSKPYILANIDSKIKII